MFRRSPQARTRVVAISGLLLGIIAQFSFIGTASAAVGFQAAYIRLDRMKINTTTGFTVCATPASAATENKVLVTFPATYTLDTTAAHYVADSTNLPTGSTFWLGMTTGTTTASNVTGQVVTFPSGDLTVGTQYCFHATFTTPPLTTATVAANSQQAQIATQTSGAVAIDTTSVALANIADDTITVSATVPPSFQFALSGNTDTFTGNLDPAAVVSTTGKTATITTNAKGGWIAWAKDSQQGLRSTVAAYTIPNFRYS